MESIFELTKQIGEEIKKTTEYLEMENAKEAFDTDPIVLSLLEKYNDVQNSLTECYQNEESEEKAQELNLLLNQIYRSIMETNANKRYDNARAGVEGLLRRIDSAIIREVTGEEPGDCSHECSSCSGCH